jgi:4-hydroxy-2-oxoheptanedioate aldolase
VRAGLIHEDYVAREAELVTLFAMIESESGLDNVDAIVATPGLDGIYIGPYDLAMSMGLPPSADGKFDPRVDRAIETVLKKTRAAGLIAGMLAPDGAKAADLIRRGFQFVTISNDIRAFQGVLKNWIREVGGA